MNVSSITTNPAPATTASERSRSALQALLLKKALESQQEQADEVSRAAEGKGHIVDLRV